MRRVETHGLTRNRARGERNEALVCRVWIFRRSACSSAASLVGKAVMAVLFLASLWCWVLIIEGAVSVVRLRRAVRQARAGGALAKSLIRRRRRRRRGSAPPHSGRDGRRTAVAHFGRDGARRARTPDALRGRLAQSRGHFLGCTVCRPVRHRVGHHVELRRHRPGAGHVAGDGCARHRGIARSDGLRPRGGDSRLDRL